MPVKCQLDCAMPLQVGCTEPFGQPPLSRPSDQNASRPTCCPLAHDTTFDASASEKTGPVSFLPIIGVTPRLAAVSFGQIDLTCASVLVAAAMTASPHSWLELKSMVIGFTMSMRAPWFLALCRIATADGSRPYESAMTRSG